MPRRKNNQRIWFLCATQKRWVDFEQMPTTIVAEAYRRQDGTWNITLRPGITQECFDIVAARAGRTPTSGIPA